MLSSNKIVRKDDVSDSIHNMIETIHENKHEKEEKQWQMYSHHLSLTRQPISIATEKMKASNSSGKVTDTLLSQRSVRRTVTFNDYQIISQSMFNWPVHLSNVNFQSSDYGTMSNDQFEDKSLKMRSTINTINDSNQTNSTIQSGEHHLVSYVVYIL